MSVNGEQHTRKRVTGRQTGRFDRLIDAGNFSAIQTFEMQVVVVVMVF